MNAHCVCVQTLNSDIILKRIYGYSLGVSLQKIMCFKMKIILKNGIDIILTNRAKASCSKMGIDSKSLA